MNEEMIAILERACPGSDVRRLIAMQAITAKTARRALIAYEFHRIFRTTKRTAHDIDEELAARFDVSRIYVLRVRKAVPFTKKETN